MADPTDAKTATDARKGAPVNWTKQQQDDAAALLRGTLMGDVKALEAALATERTARTAAEARVKELEAAGIALYRRWQQFTVERGGWGNQENAYYDLAKHAQHEWNALRAAIKEPSNG